MTNPHLWRVVCAFLFSLITVSASAALFSRLGGQAAYDDVLDITWITNAGLSGNNNWNDQVAWANGLNYLGFDGWRLASISVAAGLPTGTSTNVVFCSEATELACRDNELGYMFYQNLGGSAFDDLTGTQTVGDVTFTNIQGSYWSGTAAEPFFNSAWFLTFVEGFQNDIDKNLGMYAWAVRDGDVSIEIPFDINPQSCRNPLNVKQRGLISAAILGTTDLDVAQIDPASLRLESVPPIRSAQEDVGTPFEPFSGKEEAFDCNDFGSDGLIDLTLKFKSQDVIAALGDVEDGEVKVLGLTGNLKEEFGHIDIKGEDVVVIIKKGRQE